MDSVFSSASFSFSRELFSHLKKSHFSGINNTFPGTSNSGIKCTLCAATADGWCDLPHSHLCAHAPWVFLFFFPFHDIIITAALPQQICLFFELFFSKGHWGRGRRGRCLCCSLFYPGLLQTVLRKNLGTAGSREIWALAWLDRQNEGKRRGKRASLRSLWRGCDGSMKKNKGCKLNLCMSSRSEVTCTNVMFACFNCSRRHGCPVAVETHQCRS